MTSIGHDRLFARFQANLPANPASIDRCQAELSFRLPADYVRFLQQMNGGEGFVGKNYLRVWPVEQLVGNNKRYNVEDGAPGIFLFGTDGGGEAFAFDTRSTPSPIVAIPFILDLEDVIFIARNFESFLQHLYHSESVFP
jgi:hypothetical protein